MSTIASIDVPPYRYRATVEYDGSNFAGWQEQPHQDVLTIQGVLQVGLFRYCGEHIKVYAAGRTDAGVHATGQVIHFDLSRKRTEYEIERAVNYHLRPHPVSIREVTAVTHAFHARFSARQRQYIYQILNRPAPSPLFAGRAWHVPQKLDVTMMTREAQSLVGTHDFTSFRSVHCSATSSIRTIDEISVIQDYKREEVVLIHIKARSFLHNQVRIITGNLYKVGIGAYNAGDLSAILAARDRTVSALTAPPHGLYLSKVIY